MKKHQLMLGTLAAAIGGMFGGTASAQDAAGTEPELSASAPVAGAQENDAAEDEEKKNPMGWIGLGLKLGAGGVGSGEFETDNPAYSPAAAGAGISSGGPCPVDQEKCTVESDARAGFQLTLAITMGGDGFGWDLDPYLNFASDGTAMGLYTGPKFDIHVMDPLYIGFGFGLKAAYVSGDNFDYGADLYGRVPVRGTYYLHNDLGLVAELGLGYGASGYVALPEMLADGTETDPELSFGTALTWDFTAGVRWP